MKTLYLSATLLLSAALAEANWFLNQEQQAAENYNQGHYEEAVRDSRTPIAEGSLTTAQATTKLPVRISAR